MSQELEQKSIGSMEWKIASDAQYPNGYIEGYISVKGSIDSYGDTIVDGAYEGMPDFIKAGFATVGHENSDLPVCYIEEAKEDAKGLWVRAPFHSTAEAQDARRICEERRAAGKDVGLSIDYYTLDREYKTDEQGRQIRILKKIRVIGFAIVNNPAEKRAVATAIKSGSGRPNEEQFNSLLAELDDWTSREEWIAVNRKQGLSDAHREKIGAVMERLSALVEVKADPQEDDVPLGAILELEQFAASIQGA